MSSSPRSPRKEGGQPGNQNAVKHGFYAIKPEVLSRLDLNLKGDLLDEIDALRSLVDATLTTFDRHEQPTLEQCQSTLRVVSQAFDTMKGLHLMRSIIFSKQITRENFLEGLAGIPSLQD